MPIKAEFGFRIDFANDPTPVEALKALTSPRTRAQEVTEVDPIMGRGRYVGLIINRRGDDPLRAVQDSVLEMERAGLQVTSVRGVGRNGNARAPHAPLDEVTAQANAWIADPDRPIPEAGGRRSRSEQIAWLRTCLDRIIDDDGATGDEAFAATAVGAEVDSLRRRLAHAKESALSPGDFRLLRRRLVALYLCCCERDRSAMAGLTQNDINQMEFQYGPACHAQWRARRTAHGRVVAIRRVLERGVWFDDQLADTLNPMVCAADIVDMLDATADLSQPPDDH